MKPMKPTLRQIKEQFEANIQPLYDTLALVPVKGNTIYECQNMQILQAINHLESCVSGLEESDLITDEEE